jgi:O-antigen/teichoic acid export membrane protein
LKTAFTGRPDTGLGFRLIANTLFNFLGQLYVLVLGIAVVPYVVHRLGAELYGLITVVAALGGFAGLLNLGMGRALSKYISELYWQGEMERIRTLLQTALAVCLFAGAAGCMLLIVFRKYMSVAFFHMEGGVERFVTFALSVTALGVLFSMTTESLSALPVALQRFDIYNRMNILTSTVRNLGAVLVLALGLFVKGVLLVYLFSSFAALLGYIYYCRKLIPRLSLCPKVTWPDFKRLFGFSVPVFLAGVSALVAHRVDRVLVACFLPISAVAFYAIPYSLAEKTSMGVGNITSVIFPSASELLSMQAHQKVQELYIRASKMVLLAGMPVTILLLAIPAQILGYFVGKEYAVEGALPLRFLAAGFFFNILAHVPYVVAQGIDRPWISAKYSMINGLANLALFLTLIPRYGIVGAGMAFLISQAVIMPLLIWEVNRLLGISWASLLLRSYLRPLACGAAVFGLLWLSRSHASSLLNLVFIAASVLAVFAVLALAGAIDARERTGIYEQLNVLRFRREPVNV